MDRRIILEVRSAKDSEETPEATTQLLAGIGSALSSSLLKRLTGTQPTITLEIASLNQLVYFIVTCAAKDENLVRSQIAAQYPTAVITSMEDYLPPWSSYGHHALGHVTLTAPSYLPLKTYDKFVSTDPLSAILGVMGRLSHGTAAIMQLVVTAAPGSWNHRGRNVIRNGVSPDPLVFKAHPQAAAIEEKIKTKAYTVGIRLMGIAKDAATADHILVQLGSSLGTYSLAEANSLRFNRVRQREKFLQSMIDRSPQFIPMSQHLNVQELASLFHFPTITHTGLRNLTWGKTLKGEPPDNLPVDEFLSPSDREQTTFFAKTEFKNRLTPYGIKLADRRRHFYALGKSGTGKSTLIAKMAIDDINKGQGIAVIDPHGDLVEGILLDYIPNNRINDVVYLDPSLTDNPFHLNPLEVLKPEYKDLTVSNIMSIFTKIWANVWSARMEYILRNVLATLVEVPGSTMLDIPLLLTDDNFRAGILTKVDPVVNRVIHDFWNSEYNQYNDKFRNEAIAPILNKVGQFISSPKIRSIIGHPKSTVTIEDFMENKRIVLINLSQGKIGEENAALLGAMFITQFQLAAMNRINILEDLRKDFFLYVDEFQNFATTSFIKILSEARKYRLGLILANQYMAQLEEPIQKAIFGNVGTIITFVVGADDASHLIKEFGDLYTQDDLVNLGKYQIINKVTIDSRISNPFPAYTLPPEDDLRTNNRSVVLASSQEQFTTKKGEVIPSLRDLIPPSAPKTKPYKENKGDKETRDATKAELIKKIIVGQQYEGKVTSVKDYGAFIEVLPGLEGLVHVSNMSKDYIKHPSEVLKEGDKVKVLAYEVDPQGRLNLTMTFDKPLPTTTPKPILSTTSKPALFSTADPLDSIRRTGFKPTVLLTLIKDKKVLLGFRRSHSLWQFPQAGIDPGSTAQSIIKDKLSHKLGLPLTQETNLLGQEKLEFSSRSTEEPLVDSSGKKIPLKGKHYFIYSLDARDVNLSTIEGGEYDDLLWCDTKTATDLFNQTEKSGKLRIALSTIDLLKQNSLID